MSYFIFSFTQIPLTPSLCLGHKIENPPPTLSCGRNLRTAPKFICVGWSNFYLFEVKGIQWFDLKTSKSTIALSHLVSIKLNAMTIRSMLGIFIKRGRVISEVMTPASDTSVMAFDSTLNTISLTCIHFFGMRIKLSFSKI